MLSDFNFIGDVVISEVDGNVTMRDTNFTLDDLSFQLITGDLTVQNVNLDGDLAINQVEGNVVLKDTNFTLEDVSILLVGGDLTVQNNVQLNLLVQEISGMVQIIDNVIVVSSVNKNTMVESSYAGMLLYHSHALTMYQLHLVVVMSSRLPLVSVLLDCKPQ